jgi:hypothetical protein
MDTNTNTKRKKVFICVSRAESAERERIHQINNTHTTPYFSNTKNDFFRTHITRQPERAQKHAFYTLFENGNQNFFQPKYRNNEEATSYATRTHFHPQLTEQNKPKINKLIFKRASPQLPFQHASPFVCKWFKSIR